MPPDRSGANSRLTFLALAWLAVPSSLASGQVTPAKPTTPDAPVPFLYPSGLAVGRDGTIYVASVGDSSVAIFAPGDTAMPTRRIRGPRSGLVGPGGIALDSRGRIYVSDGVHRRNGFGSITVYPSGATGDVAPLRIIRGEKTGLIQPRRIAVGRDGTIYVVNLQGGILGFSPRATGAVEPRRVIGLGDSVPPNDVDVLDPDGLLIADGYGLTLQRRADTIRRPLVTRLRAGEPRKPWSPLFDEPRPSTRPLVALGPTGELYVAESFPEKEPDGSLRRHTRVVSVYGAEGSDTVALRKVFVPRGEYSEIEDMAVGKDGSLYLLYGNQVVVYPPEANGDAPPARTIAGASTGLTIASGLALDRRGRLFVTNDGGREPKAPLSAPS